MSLCGPLRLHSPPVRHANIILHLSPPTVTFRSHDSSETKILNPQPPSLSPVLLSFSFIIFLHYNLIFLFLILSSSSCSMSLAISFLLHIIFQRTLDNLVGILTRLWAVSPTKDGLTSGTGKTFTNSPNYPTDFVFDYNPYLLGNRDYFPMIQRSVRETEKAVFYFRSKK